MKCQHNFCLVLMNNPLGGKCLIMKVTLYSLHLRISAGEVDNMAVNGAYDAAYLLQVCPQYLYLGFVDKFSN